MATSSCVGSTWNAGHPWTLATLGTRVKGAPSSYTRYDGLGAAHDIVQGEGGEQGDPLMPALFSLAIQPALHETEGLLQDGEGIFAFLDDVYVVASPLRVKPLHDGHLSGQLPGFAARPERWSRGMSVWLT